MSMSRIYQESWLHHGQSETLTSPRRILDVEDKVRTPRSSDVQPDRGLFAAGQKPGLVKSCEPEAKALPPSPGLSDSEREVSTPETRTPRNVHIIHGAAVQISNLTNSPQITPLGNEVIQPIEQESEMNTPVVQVVATKNTALEEETAPLKMEKSNSKQVHRQHRGPRLPYGTSYSPISVPHPETLSNLECEASFHSEGIELTPKVSLKNVVDNDWSYAFNFRIYADGFTFKLFGCGFGFSKKDGFNATLFGFGINFSKSGKTFITPTRKSSEFRNIEALDHRNASLIEIGVHKSELQPGVKMKAFAFYILGTGIQIGWPFAFQGKIFGFGVYLHKLDGKWNKGFITPFR